MLVSQLIQSEEDPPKEDNFSLERPKDLSPANESSLETYSPEEVNIASSDEYLHLQRRLILTTLILAALAAIISAIVFDIPTTTSLLVGSLSGVLYLRLLARSIGKLGNLSTKVSKFQLLVPVLLVLATSRLPQLELIPALLGFLLYKPAMIIQVILES